MDKELFNVLYNDMEFEEAVKFFKNKLPITKEEFKKLSEECERVAFTVSGYSHANIIEQFYNEVLKAIETGTTLEAFKKNMNSFLELKGYEGVTNFQAENIFRTNLQTAYNVGHYEQMTSNDMIQLRPYWRYEAVEDNATRPTHLAMDGLVYRADDPVWDTWYPPNGYKCRCTVTSLSARQVEANGIDVKNGMPPIIPDEGFHTNPAKIPFKPDISKYPESLQTAFKRLTDV